MGTIALVFAGQGAQAPGMGQKFYEQSPAARQIFDTAEKIRPGTLSQCFEGPREVLNDTANAQPCLYTVNLAAAAALTEAGIAPAMLAGFSLGELAALTYAGAMDFADGLRLVCRRGEIMQKAAQQHPGGMAAVLKLPNETVEQLCAARPSLYPANYNCPGQLVVSGTREALDWLREAVKTAGGRCVPLAVSGGFHSPFMSDAALELGAFLQNFTFAPPRLPLYVNDSARPYPADAAAALTRQVQSPVRWQESVERMAGDGADTFIEVGVGKVLCGLITKINPSLRVFAVENPEDLAAAAREVGV